MSSYTDTIYSRKDKILAISRRHFVAAAAALPAVSLAGGMLMPSTAHAAKPQILQSDHVLGMPTAPITIIEYASLTCGHCGNFHKFTYGELKKNYVDTGKVKFVYRHFPLDRYAFIGAILAECAGEKGDFFGMIDAIFQQQEAWTRQSDPALALIELGQQNGVALEEFVTCLTNQELVGAIASESLIGSSQYGVNSTPTIFIQGEKYERSRDFQVMDDYLKTLM
ncbi:MAG: disulfide bond formation protein DsbA [Sneathiella sp.]|uniref:DsbA family protein n=1 Tax=Sneathiella sp. TaxID=1964365 RepID=UPI000C549895|nr:DsbA family protein [Sneathiella sp.]MAL78605.1 disulfide bond formation protein DsbA [Sneathiella sp.]|tara:strand:+ start:188 stop:859 length:672 start_codon:yes stop_codon:yes gene_type:complete